MGNEEAVLDQWENRVEYSSGRKVKKQETPEDKKWEKFHLKLDFFELPVSQKIGKAKTLPAENFDPDRFFS